MSWSAPSVGDVLSEFTPSEAATIKNLQGDTGNLNPDAILARVVAEIRDYIRAGGYAIDTENASYLPLGLHGDAIAITRWRLLISAPQFKQFQTEERKKAMDDAIGKMKAIATQKFAVEPPTSSSTNPASGNWNSENKIIMRTHPVPRPAGQTNVTANDYANPDAPADQEEES